MVSCKLTGRLGNHLFQIATSYTLAYENDDNLIIDSKYKKTINCSLDSYMDNILRAINIGDVIVDYVYKEKHFYYDVIEYKKNIMLLGYFQSEKYLNRDLILNLFKIDEKSKSIIDDLQIPKDAISIHVRRGDYVDKQDRHPLCSVDYYNKAIDYFGKNKEYIILSDDPEWCKNNFKKYRVIENQKDYIDLYIMSTCENNIISNSSFSWWGAWLNDNNDKTVIAPSVWFGPKKIINTKDLIPKDWILI